MGVLDGKVCVVTGAVGSSFSTGGVYMADGGMNA